MYAAKYLFGTRHHLREIIRYNNDSVTSFVGHDDENRCPTIVHFLSDMDRKTARLNGALSYDVASCITILG